MITRESGIQQEMVGRLKKAGGMLGKVELDGKMHKYRIGAAVYNHAYSGLIKDGIIQESGGGEGDPKKVYLLRDPDEIVYQPDAALTEAVRGG